MVSNSAGLCLSTNDLVSHYGGKPANFVDLGGSTIHEQIDTLFNMLNDDENVRVIFVNCYGGIMSIEKLVATLQMNYDFGNISKPVVFRAKGNGAEAVDRLAEYCQGRYELYVEADFDKACRTAVEVAAQ